MEKSSKLVRWYRKYILYNQTNSWDKLALSYMKSSKYILDIGCGEGRFISNDPKKIIGIDHNKNTINLCKNKGYNVKYAKATKLPFKDNYFDAIHCSQIIEHLFPKEAHKLLSEINRVLKINGILCLRTPLLNPAFYDDFTHIKPYYPKSILHYLKTEETKKIVQTTLDEIPCSYKVIKLKYKRNPIFHKLKKIKILLAFFNLLYRFGITSFKKTEYIMILKKIK